MVDRQGHIAETILASIKMPNCCCNQNLQGTWHKAMLDIPTGRKRLPTTNTNVSGEWLAYCTLRDQHLQRFSRNKPKHDFQLRRPQTIHSNAPETLRASPCNRSWRQCNSMAPEHLHVKSRISVMAQQHSGHICAMAEFNQQSLQFQNSLCLANRLLGSMSQWPQRPCLRSLFGRSHIKRSGRRQPSSIEQDKGEALAKQTWQLSRQG